MKLATYLAAALLAGCSSYGSWSPGAWSHGSWLDDIGRPESPPLVMSDEQAGHLQREAAQLRGESEAVRVRLAGERDRLQRLRRYEELRALGDRLVPIERALRDAGRATRAAGGTVPAA